MPELSAIYIGIATSAVLLGIVVGWLVRSKRCAREKLAIQSGWQEQIEAQRAEHGRLVEQNKNLMEQVNQFQASSKDATNRARELSDALKEAFSRRDELQREIKDVRGNLESLLAERQRRQSSVSDQSTNGDSAASIKEKDDKIFRLSRELESWQGRLPPLIDRFRERDTEAKELESELAEARKKIADLESRLTFDQTLVEPADARPDDLAASNETIIETAIEAILEDAVEPGEDHDGAAAANGAEHESAFKSDQHGLRDNLKMIKGVGPAIEKTLNELGIFRFSQIAAMSEYDIDRVAKRLKGFRSRIYREDWIGQARELDDRHAGEL